MITISQVIPEQNISQLMNEHAHIKLINGKCGGKHVHPFYETMAAPRAQLLKQLNHANDLTRHAPRFTRRSGHESGHDADVTLR